MNIIKTLAENIHIRTTQVESAVKLLDAGDTVPFISRYRKEVTGGLTDKELRELEEQLQYLRDLEARKLTILKSIEEQGKLTSELEHAIEETTNKATLEDLYLPYKPKRRTKAQIAREAGLEPLALTLLENPNNNPKLIAQEFINEEKGIADVESALEGARQILMEQFTENAVLLGRLRDYLWQYGIVQSKVVKDKENEGAKFSDYFDYKEPIKKIPSHRALALFRGRNEGFLHVDLILEAAADDICKNNIANVFGISDQKRPADIWLLETVNLAWKAKIFIKLELDLMAQLRETAEDEAIKVFANNLKHLLLAAPAGSRVTMGLDPGFRTGVKLVVVDATGKVLAHLAIFPHAPQNKWDEALSTLAILCKKYQVELISIGNGTASRETDKLVCELISKHPELKLTKVMVSEAGASVYSASKLAEAEFPELDVTVRGAISIARRLQDPLAELVKIEPKAIGVGQYQHDVNQSRMGKVLQTVVEDCVNAVGVDVNTASAPLLTSVAGLNETIAQNVVSYRNEHGAFKSRQELKKIPRLGEKTFEQAAGFLRIINGVNPLDASAVHPEAYAVVERILSNLHKTIKEVMGNNEVLSKIKPQDYVDAHFGIPTITDIIKELEKPGRDPRPEFKTATFKEGIHSIEDLKPGMLLEGVVTNVANFGAFVDIGVHQDGLVHKSMMANKFVQDPNQILKAGDIVKIKVIEIDTVRHRIALSMRLEDAVNQQSKVNTYTNKPTSKVALKSKATQPVITNTKLAESLSAAFGKK